MGLVVFTASTNTTIGTFTEFGTQLLTWLITTFQTILSFMIDNPICFVGLAMMLIVAAIGTLRHIIGGKAPEEKKKKRLCKRV